MSPRACPGVAVGAQYEVSIPVYLYLAELKLNFSRDILFSNFHVMGADAGPSISQNSGNNGSSPGTSLMEVSNVAFVNFTGYLNGAKSATHGSGVSCSNVQ